jgi:hypothetical protein
LINIESFRFPPLVSAIIQKCLAIETKLEIGHSLEQPQTKPNDAQQNPMSRKKEESPSPSAHFTRIFKQFDEQQHSNTILFNELSADEIIANTTEIDDNEGGGSGVDVVELISTVSSTPSRECEIELVFIDWSSGGPNLVEKVVEKIPEKLVGGKIRISYTSVSL